MISETVNIITFQNTVLLKTKYYPINRCAAPHIETAILFVFCS